jgi:hypothetical protein
MRAVRMLLKTLVISTFFVPLTALASAGKIEKVGMGPSVKCLRAGSAVHLKEGDKLEVGDELTTDDKTAVDIRLEDETLIRVGVNSSYKVQEDSKLHSLVHRLLSGVVRVLVKPTETDGTKPRIKFRMETPEGTIGVRGTEFVVIRQKDKTQLKGLDGTVLFGPVGDDFSNDTSFVLVQRGFESEIKPGAAPAKVQKLDLKGYLNSINGPNGAFGPLSARVASAANRYARNSAPPISPAISAAVVMPSTPPPANVGQEKPAEKVRAEPKQDYQVLLLKAALDGDEQAATSALKHGAEIDAPASTSQGKTALQVAMLYDHEGLFTFLIRHCADVDKKDDDGLTPLMLAATQKVDFKYVESLVGVGAADLDLRDKAGKKALDLAREHGYTEMANYLASDQAVNDFNAAVTAINNGKVKCTPIKAKPSAN